MRTLLFLTLFGLLSSSPPHVINFDSAALGQAPLGWTFPASDGSQPKWEIRRDQSATTQPYVLARIAGADGANIPLAIFNQTDLQNGEISVRFKPVSGEREQAGGLVFRYRDENNFYLVRADATHQFVCLIKVVNGHRIQVGEAVKRDLPRQEWSILKVAAKGNRFQIYVDHRRMLRVDDNSLPAAGKAGLWAPTGAITYFDDFRIDPQ
jgi:hypothetical protein